MKLFISQPMCDRDDDEIADERDAVVSQVRNLFPDEEVEVLDAFPENAPRKAKPLHCLARSLDLLADADAVAFAPGWGLYTGCRIEHECADAYGIRIVLD